ncbi:plastocyanin/azurin family copper-binding protein [Halobellus sp. H-GB7]|uniref:plastocyanin/azurin family copper-binding protein n=1 Tax=Halobellus sp. H-GB7 TaxID=3069756 RepID=UPI0027B669B9|nr:plastocyanin/azurin family copper-binding protein [Halobellus sp. H-GB7]MDQ2053356.1 plastocyanin/azurin family copper-binding protein [Halobellus sp. H-GB7]
MKRRDFLRAASVPAAATTASATAGLGAAQETTETSGGTATGTATGTSTGTGTATGTASGSGGGGGSGETVTVTVGPGGSLVFEPGTSEPLQIAPGTTVEFVWDSDNHNIVVENQPDGANWQGHQPLENTGFTYTHTFDTLGTYEYYCEPHRTAGMVATIEVVENPNAGGGGGGEKELHELGVPIHAHWVGAATILGILVTVIFTFYILKYGESAHTGTGRN